MFDKLHLLKLKGYYPDAILDIGAYHGDWTMQIKMAIYPHTEYHLFEAIDYRELDHFTNKYNVVLSSKRETVNWYEMKNTGDSFCREKTRFFADCQVIQRETIDLNSFADKFVDKKNILIKIDCQGAEIPILQGASEILNKTDFIVMEMPLFGVYNEGVASFGDHIKYMESIGFVPYDVLESHYMNGFNMQIDMLFINKNHVFNSHVNELLL
jgi:FkbM family methyltransferase